jgi:hypothetical protein
MASPNTSGDASAARQPSDADTDPFALVLEAAERCARELLDQASGYERLGMAPIATETLNDHYRPLRTAIDRIREQHAADAAGLNASSPDRC